MTYALARDSADSDRAFRRTRQRVFFYALWRRDAADEARRRRTRPGAVHAGLPEPLRQLRQ